MTDSPTPRRPDLWARVVPAVHAVHSIGAEKIERNGYVRRVELPKFKTNEHGWPSVIRSELSPSSEHPINWSEVVSPGENPWGNVVVDDVPEVAALVDFIRSDDHLSTRMGLPGSRENEIWGRWLAYDCLDLVGSIVGRATALGVGMDERSLLPIYLERERAIVDPILPVELVVPILLTHSDIDRFDLAPNARVERLDEATNVARAARLQSSVNCYLQSAATHALVLTDVELGNPGPSTRSLTRNEQVDRRMIDLAFQAIEIATSKAVGYAQILLRPLGWSDGWLHDLPAIIRLDAVRRYPPSLDEQGWNGPGQVINASDITTLPVIFRNLSTATPRVELAARRLFQSDLRVDQDDVLIDACIGIEALLGEGRDELTHRMSQRAAVALAQSSAGSDPHVIYELAKKIYAERSVVVHGGTRKKPTIKIGEQEISTPASAWILLRYLLLSALESETPWTPADLDRRLLSSLAEQRPAE